LQPTLDIPSAIIKVTTYVTGTATLSLHSLAQASCDYAELGRSAPIWASDTFCSS